MCVVEMRELLMTIRFPFGPPLILLSVLLAGCDRAPSSAAQNPPPPDVGVLTLAAKPITLTTELPGRTTAFLIADVRPQVSGLITQRIFTEGAEVTAGQQLYQIDPATYKAAADTAAATLAHNQAVLASAQAKAARYKPLAAAQAVSQQDYDDAAAMSAEAVADIASARASVEQAQINLAYTKVMAPISGRIGRSSVTPGALVTASQATALATVTQLDPIYVDVTQSAGTLLRLRRELAAGTLQASGPNQAKVDLMLEDGTKYEKQGTLQFSEVNVDETTGTVLLRAIFPNPDHLLLPGLYVRAELQEGTNNGALLVPQQAVSHNTHGDATALIVGADNKVVLKIIQTSRALGNDWVVTGGLAVGDRVIVDGLQKAKPGAEVHGVEVTAAPAAAPVPATTAK
ncbi:MAG: efflux transporter periplasmic adaptor subunit [Tardiphaga sp.]|nr:efflux transporter periplasmic adaptor subunit [Tardiphaga sp.]